jgi:flagellin-like hook-associated protein FlgL
MISPISNFRVLGPLHDLGRNQVRVEEILKRLSTGRRINSGRDDPAGLIASERLEAEIRSLEAESRALARADANANIAEANTAQLSSIYREIDSLTLRAANSGAISVEERDAYQLQIDSLSASAQRISSSVLSSYGGVNLPGTGNAELAQAVNDARVAVANITSGGPHDLASGNLELARTALASASTGIASARGRIGAYQRYDVLPRIASNLVAIENLTASRSRIADADLAVETSLLAQAQVVETASLKALSIVNQRSGSVLDLIS